MGNSSIQWTEKTWNPVVGCSKVSPGCRECYAEVMAKRLRAMALADIAAGRNPGRKRAYIDAVDDRGRWTGKLIPLPEALTDPLKWRKPQMVFVNSMSDLFHADVPDEFIAAVFGVMAACPQHTFQVLTKRPARAREWFPWITRQAANGGTTAVAACRHFAQAVSDHGALRDGDRFDHWTWPLPNVWLGCSAEDDQRMRERWPELAKCPAAVRFVSMEPLLGEIDAGFDVASCGCCERRGSRWVELPHPVQPDGILMAIDAAAGRPIARAGRGCYRASSNPHGALSVDTGAGKLGIRPAEFELLPAPDWVIVGGESGPNARPCNVAWIRSIVCQCREAQVPVFVKQLGHHVRGRNEDSEWMEHLDDPKGGDPAEWPEDLRVREFPERGEVPNG